MHIFLSKGGRTHCHPKSPGDAGTRVLGGFYWLCIHKVYLYLSPDWNGLCVLVCLSFSCINTYVVYASEAIQVTSLHSTPSLRRVRRHDSTSIYAPHDSVWGSNVPDDS